jgi:hypothetical protein
MFRGTMIDELISTVERAEQNARRQQEQNASGALNGDHPVRRMEWQEISEVA